MLDNADLRMQWMKPFRPQPLLPRTFSVHPIARPMVRQARPSVSAPALLSAAAEDVEILTPENADITDTIRYVEFKKILCAASIV